MRMIPDAGRTEMEFWRARGRLRLGGERSRRRCARSQHDAGKARYRKLYDFRGCQ